MDRCADHKQGSERTEFLPQYPNKKWEQSIRVWRKEVIICTDQH